MIQRTEGEKMILFCNATGNPVPTISWIINGFSLDTNNSSRMNLSYEGKQLTIKNVRRTDSALYRCVAENSLGNVTSYNTTLEVHCKLWVFLINKTWKFSCKTETVHLAFHAKASLGHKSFTNIRSYITPIRVSISLKSEGQSTIGSRWCSYT